jgi:deoxycytidylate deaminase
MHAEMNVLRFAQPGDEIEVIRFKKRSYERTMARPCVLCIEALQNAGITKVRYTNWNGEWEELYL